MATVEELTDFDNFLYYGEADVVNETQHDLMILLLQKSRRLLYGRSRGSAEIDQFENSPNTISLSILVPFSVTQSVGKRNIYVSSGEEGLPDRRIALSQGSIRVKNDGNALNIFVEYISLSNFERIESVSIPLGQGA